jgi:hypothetical protein
MDTFSIVLVTGGAGDMGRIAVGKLLQLGPEMLDP